MRRTALRRVSKRRAEVLPDLDAARWAAIRRDGGCCQAAHRWPEVDCDGALVAHHLVTRSAWPAGLCVLANLLTLCDQHHRAVHSEPARARELRLLLHSWERP